MICTLCKYFIHSFTYSLESLKNCYGCENELDCEQSLHTSQVQRDLKTWVLGVCSLQSRRAGFDSFAQYVISLPSRLTSKGLLAVYQRVRYKTIGFNEQTNGLHVRYNF